MGARGGCYEKETFAWTLRCRADRKDAGGVSDAIADRGEGAEDDGTRGGKLVQMVHDLDLIAVDREDVLLAGVGGRRPRAWSCPAPFIGLFADVKAVP